MAEEEKKTTPPPEPEAPKAEAPKAEPITFTPEEVEDGKGIAWLCYIIGLFWIPWLMKKENKFVMAHVKQGLILTIFVFGGSIIFTCLAFVFPPIALVNGLLFLAGLVFTIIGIISAVKGEYKPLPLIGPLAEQWFKKF